MGPRTLGLKKKEESYTCFRNALQNGTIFKIGKRKTTVLSNAQLQKTFAHLREAPWNDKCCSNGFLPGGGVENPVQMVWGSYLVNINHYWDTKFSSYFTII